MFMYAPRFNYIVKFFKIPYFQWLVEVYCYTAIHFLQCIIFIFRVFNFQELHTI